MMNLLVMLEEDIHLAQPASIKVVFIDAKYKLLTNNLLPINKAIRNTIWTLCRVCLIRKWCFLFIL